MVKSGVAQVRIVSDERAQLKVQYVFDSDPGTYHSLTVSSHELLGIMVEAALKAGSLPTAKSYAATSEVYYILADRAEEICKDPADGVRVFFGGKSINLRRIE